MFFNRKKFPDSLTKAVFTTTYVIKDNSLITLIGHELDGDWQFMGDEPVGDYKEIGMVVSLEQIIKHDKSVLKVADMPKGYQATRKSKTDEWTIIKIQYSDDEIAEMGFVCSQCGELHNDIPMAYTADAPYEYYQIPADQINVRTDLTSDTCIIDDEKFYIKGQIKIPVDNNEEFFWCVWVSISELDYDRTIELWNEENRFLTPAYEGKLSTKLECYPDTLDLNVKVHTRKKGIIPLIEILESTHPLFLEQESGINRERVISFARQIVYNH